jgi:hypothetical protein
MRAPLFIGTVVVTCGLAIACDAPKQGITTPFAPTPAPAQIPSIAFLAGQYTLSVNLSCTELPETERQRTYQATLSVTNFSYLAIRLAGEGYATSTVVGDMWPQANGDVMWRMNNFDITGCGDGTPEVLPDGTALLVCGSGFGTPADTTIKGSLSTQVVLGDAAGTRPRQCPSPDSFEFRRSQSP